MFASTALAGQNLNVVWSSGSFSALQAPGGGVVQDGFTSGFNLITEKGESVWHAECPDDHDPCASTIDPKGHPGGTFTLKGGCFGDAVFRFHCYTRALTPNHCKTWDEGYNLLAENSGNENTEFISVAVSVDGYCGASFELPDGVTCGKDETGFEAKANV